MQMGLELFFKSFSRLIRLYIVEVIALKYKYNNSAFHSSEATFSNSEFPLVFSLGRGTTNQTCDRSLYGGSSKTQIQGQLCLSKRGSVQQQSLRENVSDFLMSEVFVFFKERSYKKYVVSCQSQSETVHNTYRLACIHKGKYKCGHFVQCRATD